MILGVPLESGKPGAHRKRSTYRPLRIQTHFDSSIQQLVDEKRDYVVNVLLPQAMHFWQNALSVIPSNAPIRLKR